MNHPFPPPIGTVIDQIRHMLEPASGRRYCPYIDALEPIFRDHDPVEVAAAAVALLKNTEVGRPCANTRSPSAAARAPELLRGRRSSASVSDGLSKRPFGAITGEAALTGLSRTNRDPGEPFSSGGPRVSCPESDSSSQWYEPTRPRSESGLRPPARQTNGTERSSRALTKRPRRIRDVAS